MAAGAVPLVPVAPPPRAVRMTPRIPRPYVPHGSQGASRRSPYAHYSASYDALRPEEPSTRRPLRERAEAPAPAPTPAPAPAPSVSERPEEAPEAERVERVVAVEADEPTVAVEPVTSEPAAPEAPEAERVPQDLPEWGDVPADEFGDTASIPTRQPVAGGTAPEPQTEGAAGPAFPTEAFDRVRSGARELGDRMREFQPDRGIVLGVCAALAALLVGGVCYAVATSWLGPFAPQEEPAPPVEQPSTEPEPVETIQPEEEQGPAEVEGAPEVRVAFADYSWDELAQISELIAAAPSDEEGVQIAAQYNLCDASGGLNIENTKDLVLSSGTTVPVTIAGFRHDDRADGSGVAGISFVARASAASQPLNASGEAVVWEQATLRSWLNQSFMAELPEELSASIVSVSKLTNNPAGVGGGQSITAESVWIPSCSELSGDVAAQTTNSDYAGYQMEGEQYQVYADSGVTWNDGFDYLRLGSGEDWWLRTPEPSAGAYYMTVTAEGSPHYYRNAGRELAVIVGFCL